MATYRFTNLLGATYKGGSLEMLGPVFIKRKGETGWKLPLVGG